MKLALRELRRRPGRFATATVILTLIAVLLMFLGALLDGLIANSTNALTAQDANGIVYSPGSQASFIRSRIDPDLRARIDAISGVAETGGIGLVQLGARVPGNGPRDLASVALFGYEIPPIGVPDVPGPGEAWADSSLRSSGVEEGDELLLGPARSPVTVIGFVDDTQYSGQGSLWAAPDTWRDVLSANRPDRQVADGVFQALVIVADSDIHDLPGVVDRVMDGVTESYTIDEVVESIPGVSEQRGVFNQIIGVTIVIALVVIGLFFALLTVERTALYGVLKAIGARSGTLFLGLVTQAVVVTVIAASIAATLTIVLDLLIPAGGIPIQVTTSRIVTSVVLLLVAAVLGCTFSLRRILRIDPASAIGSSS